MSDPIHIGDRVRYRQGRGWSQGVVAMTDSESGYVSIRRPSGKSVVRRRTSEVERVTGAEEKNDPGSSG